VSGLAGACWVVQRLPHLFEVGTVWRGERVVGYIWATPKECQGESCLGKRLLGESVIKILQRIKRPMLDKEEVDGRLGQES
jgi:hypothetical protein